MIREIFQYREMIYMMTKRNLSGRYKSSFFGFAWVLFNPLLQLSVYTVVFSLILKSEISNYPLYLFIALIPWLAMSGSVVEGAGCIINESALVKKIYFPRIVLPIITTLTNFIHMLLCMIVVLIACIVFTGINLNVIIYLVPVIFIEFLLALGISLILSSLCVYFRDIQWLLDPIIMTWQFMTPIMYSIDVVPSELKNLFYLNPMTHIIIAYRDILYYKKAPGTDTLFFSLLFAIILFTIGVLCFKRLERRFVEEL